MIVELKDRVFEATFTTDAEGGAYRVSQLSGKPLSRRRWRRIARAFVRVLRDRGEQVCAVKLRRSQP